MATTGPFFVPTRSSLNKNIAHEIVTFQNTKTVPSKLLKKEVSTVNSTDEIDMKKARFEVYKFAQNSLHGEDKQKSKVELAIKLGAKRRKNKYKNYKVLKEEMEKELKEAEKNKELYNIPIKRRISTLKSKIIKGTLSRKRKIGSGILNTYGKVSYLLLLKFKLSYFLNV